ncbi:MAG TPA: aminotransferase class V-fold PLP-dependent enzyme, partial [Candidatus Saccharimonadales bacterium]|nr:aminotransferase class V-fold PLP-dependent enzyme [Candidatus Saccharimonadales bacterium]
AALLGMGREALRRIPSRPDFTLDVEALQRAVEKDRGEGRLPFCVVASAGATATGAIDPIGEIADYCARERLWLHVDAAYGGFAALSSSGSALRAIGRADSVAIDPHKWLHVPFDCGALIVRDPRALEASFSEVGSYARTDEKGDREGWTFFEHGPELSRRFRALKVWMLLRHLGCDRVGRMIDHDIGVARHLAAELEAAPDMELMAPVPLSVVCFRYRPPGATEEALDALNRRILKDLQSRAVAYPTHAVLKGRFALRACILNPRTTEKDVETLLAETRAGGHALADGRSGDRS